MDIFSLLSPKYTIDERKKIRLISLFSGYDSQKLSFNYLGIDVEHYRAIEFDKYAMQSLNEIHNTNFETKDITKVSADELGIVDTENITYVLTYSFPCTDLSLAGKRAGMDRDSGTRSGLLWEVERLLKETKEKPQILIMENVPQVLSAKGWREWNVFLESLGYCNYAQVLNAKNFGIPQNRERCFMVSILGDYSYEFPKPFELKDRLKDFLEESVDEKYYLSKKMIEGMSTTKFESYKLENKILDKNGCDNTIIARFEGTPQCIRVGNYSPSGHNASSIVDTEGIAPTVMENHGTVTAVVERQNMKETLCNTLIENDLVKENDVINHSHPNVLNGKKYAFNNTLEKCVESNNMMPSMTTRPDTLGVVVKDYVGTIDYAQLDTLRPTMESRVKIDNDVSGTLLQSGNQNGIIENHKPKLVRGIGEKSEVINPLKDRTQYGWHFEQQVYDESGIVRTVKAGEGSGNIPKVINDLRIRKLTPLECFKLMGVKPRDYKKITCSNAQKYKQAGNSIVTTCLMAIYSQLFDGVDYKYYIEKLLKELRTKKDEQLDYIEELKDIYARLADDYNGGQPFNQYEEDRLVIGNVVDMLEIAIKYVKFHLSTYPCNDMLENVLDLLMLNLDSNKIEQIQQEINC